MENTEKQVPATPAEEKPVAEKMFSQAQLDAAIESRLAREKAKYADFDTYRKSHEELTTIKTKLGEYESYKIRATELEDLFNEHYKETFESIPEDKRSLVPEALSLKDRLSYIKTNKNFLMGTSSSPQPQQTQQITLPVLDKPKETKSGIPSGYATIVEFATKDPKGYREWQKKNPI